MDLAAAALASGLTLAAPVTNADLVDKIRSLRVDLALCNADKAGLRDWKDEVTQ